MVSLVNDFIMLRLNRTNRFTGHIVVHGQEVSHLTGMLGVWTDAQGSFQFFSLDDVLNITLASHKISLPSSSESWNSALETGDTSN